MEMVRSEAPCGHSPLIQSLDDDEYIDYDDDDFEEKIEGSNNAAVDPYAGAHISWSRIDLPLSESSGIFFSKDRREEVIEVEEEPELVPMPGVNGKVPLMTQGQWMKGCPEGSEQSFLFSLYRELSEGECRCPEGCGESITRKKSDFYALFVSFNHVPLDVCLKCPSAEFLCVHQTPPVHCTPDMYSLLEDILLRLRRVLHSHS